MNIQQIHQLLLTHPTLRSAEHLTRYVKLMEHYILTPCVKGPDTMGLLEAHHILPRKMWPDHIKSPWNLVVLPTKAHYIAHYLLFKSFSDRSCVFAFNQMRRVCNTSKPNCQLYQSARVELANHISAINTGRTISDEQRAIRSKQFTGTNIYRNITTGDLLRFKVGEEPMGWEPFQTGRVRTSESKALIADKMSDRIWQFDPVSKDVKFCHEIHPGYTVGYPEWLVAEEGACANHKWIYSPDSNSVLRIPNDDPIPEGYVLGRGEFNNIGFKHVNSKDVMKIVNLATKQYELIDRNSFDNTLHMKSGQSLDKVVVYEYKNLIYTQYTTLLEANAELPEFKTRSILMNELRIPKPHFNQTQSRRQFCLLHQGKLPKDIGLKVIPLLSLNYRRETIYVKS